ncbi:hypothetical protein [Helicobacter felis]|nr:hypothetical protein [Helicobacter felis]
MRVKIIKPCERVGVESLGLVEDMVVKKPGLDLGIVIKLLDSNSVESF